MGTDNRSNTDSLSFVTSIDNILGYDIDFDPIKKPPKLKPQNESNLVSFVLIPTPTSTTEIQMHDNNEIRLNFHIVYGDYQSVAQLKNTVVPKSIVQEKTALTIDQQSPKEYLINICVKSNSYGLQESWESMQNTIKMLFPSITDIQHGVKTLLNNLTLDQLLNLNGKQIIPIDTVIFNPNENTQVIYNVSGTPDGRPSRFQEFVQNEFIHPGIFQYGLPTRIYEIIKKEAESYHNRAITMNNKALASAEIKDNEEDSNNAIDEFIMAFEDCQRVKIIYNFIYNHKTDLNPNISDYMRILRSGTNLITHWHNQGFMMHELALLTGKYDRAIRFVRYAFKAAKQLKEQTLDIIADMHNHFYVDNEDVVLEKNAQLTHQLKQLERDIRMEKLNAIKLDYPIIHTRECAQEYPLSDRHLYYANKEKYDLAKKATILAKKMQYKDPLFLYHHIDIMTV